MNEPTQPAVAEPVESTVMQRATGGAAFPVLPPQDTAAGVATGYPYPESGMTLRDYFAAKAMQGMVGTASFAYDDMEKEATLCYEIADAMLAVRVA